jgi:sugar lactone lactonase YvrE
VRDAYVIKNETLIVLCLSCGMTTFAQPQAAAQGQPAPAPAAQAPATDTVAPDIPGVVKGGTKAEVVKQGFRATDGPVPLPDGSLIFWNFPDKTIVKIDKDGNASTFLTQGMGVGRNGAQAMTVDAKGRIITLDKDKVSTRIAVVYPKGSETVIADTCDGMPLPEPNDLIADRKGVYFNADAVYYVRPDGKCVKVQAESDRLNGIQLSPDEKILYVTTQGREPRTALTSANIKTDGGQDLLAYDIQVFVVDVSVATAIEGVRR